MTEQEWHQKMDELLEQAKNLERYLKYLMIQAHYE